MWFKELIISLRNQILVEIENLQCSLFFKSERYFGPLMKVLLLIRYFFVSSIFHISLMFFLKLTGCC